MENSIGLKRNYLFVSGDRECGGNFTVDSMVISSPNYPLPYDHNASCDWVLTVHPDYNVTFLFTAMDLEFHQNCLYDYVEVNSRYKVISSFPTQLT